MADDLLICGHQGLGDNVYQRPVVRAACERGRVWLATPWPQVYGDLAERGLRLVRPARTVLRTQAKNERAAPPGTWSSAPAEARRVCIGYLPASLARCGSIMRALEAGLPLDGSRFDFSLPVAAAWRDRADAVIASWGIGQRPFALVRPPTVRTEWPCPARNPGQQEMQRAIDQLRRRGMYLVSVADLDPPHEVLCPPLLTGVDRAYHGGELEVGAIAGLMARAAVTLGGVGFIVPLAIALGARAIILGGGMGAHNAPEILTDPRMDLRCIRFILPERYCYCGNRRHACDKRIDPARLQAEINGALDTWTDN